MRLITNTKIINSSPFLAQVWSKEDYAYFVEMLRDELPYTHYFHRQAITDWFSTFNYTQVIHSELQITNLYCVLLFLAMLICQYDIVVFLSPIFDICHAVHNLKISIYAHTYGHNYIHTHTVVS